MEIKNSMNDFLDAGVHFGHNKSKWNPNMAPYIFMEHNGIHLIDVKKTMNKLQIAASAAKNVAKSGRKILFVATKKQAKDIIEQAAKSVNMPYVSERWLGGMLTNFSTVRKSMKKLSTIEQMFKDGTSGNLNKKERLMMMREQEKLQRVLGGIADLKRLPAALFVVDIKKEHIAIAEANKLNLNTFAIVDTNSDPTQVDFPIPGNDDATKSIALITRIITAAISEGLSERKAQKDEQEKEEPQVEEEVKERKFRKRTVKNKE
ncbi:MAG: 30S ribosomal protein S2 [Bacteroidetes bacterium]|nr:30S ribosomal protein S2 [Bacteroidota bacterium]MBT5528967.1 30S ribosomal protein S2 [Cytophagia bacterium]MBT3799982.1 30S ribosomal protein S2 [Bacteroidota bacterium]MBT3933497.1 30S ribosomal protein S2 [Bacteroidota bacterium]MBT4339205.1 30S ribosomal protein S2 [Bacteroidota bacterium]